MSSNDHEERGGGEMRAHTMADVGAAVRSARQARGMTQAALAASVGVSRDWVVRLEKGHPRLEAQLVLDALDALDVSVSLGTQRAAGADAALDAALDAEGPAKQQPDDFSAIMEGLVAPPPEEQR
jgi:HTH-type transcriptional regulator/antitoxin HipB